MGSGNTQKRTKDEILSAIKDCKTIDELFSIVRQEHIDIRMQTLCGASSIPPKSLTFTSASAESPLDRLKAAVHLAAELNM
ncbi:MAG: hypothetical protein IJC86_01960 [Clostridia bacterium]|nr:hypothetical protein [Clostridia bacterium]